MYVVEALDAVLVTTDRRLAAATGSTCLIVAIDQAGRLKRRSYPGRDSNRHGREGQWILSLLSL
jgi:hypothetical protein